MLPSRADGGRDRVDRFSGTGDRDRLAGFEPAAGELEDLRRLHAAGADVVHAVVDDGVGRLRAAVGEGESEREGPASPRLTSVRTRLKVWRCGADAVGRRWCQGSLLELRSG